VRLSSLRAWLAIQFDDYIEETAVGRQWWALVLGFALGLGIVTGLLEVAVPAWYHPGDVVISMFLGTLIAAGLVLIARERVRARAAAIDNTGSIAALRRLAWSEFEITVGEAIRRNGYLVKQRGGFQRDHGTDLIAERGHEKVLVQCKHWLKWKVHEDAVKILFADVTTQAFTAGWLVTCGRFTGYAAAWAKERPIRLIDGEELVKLINSVSRPTELPISQPITAQLSKGPTCPNCGSRLGRLTNSYDDSQFWGCPSNRCSWTFDDPPVDPSAVRCGHGHSMAVASTKDGYAYWRCTDGRCSRKRLMNLQFARP
jgi:ssDNA-binding Zn-finger/Zn-ribbon topoisomerase 1